MMHVPFMAETPDWLRVCLLGMANPHPGSGQAGDFFSQGQKPQPGSGCTSLLWQNPGSVGAVLFGHDIDPAQLSHSKNSSLTQAALFCFGKDPSMAQAALPKL